MLQIAFVILFLVPAAVAQQADVKLATVGHFANPEITESSGIAASRQQPGVYWTINDSGGKASIYAFDRTGRDLGAWRVADAANRDWEAVAIGPCEPNGPPSCLYIGDIGDNFRLRRVVTFYRVPEPQVSGHPQKHQRTAPAERIDFTYPTGPRDVEALYVSADATVWLITKGLKRAFRLPYGNSQTAVVAESSILLPIDHGSSTLVTDAALSPDGQALAVRTYNQIYVFKAKPNGEPDVAIPPNVCDISALDEDGGEGLGWPSDGEALLLSSEGRAGQISTALCRIPE
jgi:hypothetical protein